MLAKNLVVEHNFTKNTTAADVVYFAKTSAKHYFSPLKCKVISRYASYIATQIELFHNAIAEHNAETQIEQAIWYETC